MRIPLILVFSLLCCTNISIAQGPGKLSVGWTKLFNGKDLSGWQGDWSRKMGC